ncbi:hypothetical protein FACS189445_4240 [Spirochaetia bacterium]|nr:hypothetical protein FACS189445_4240 [Spirochaetia bacterium]
MSFEGANAKDPAIGAFLGLMGKLPLELALKTPVLSDIADLSGGSDSAAGDPAAAPQGLIRRRLERRYARICVVHAELGKLDFKQAKAGTGLEDLVFAQTDFDRYKKISREDFSAFFDEGLDDFDDFFYKNNCMMDRDAVRKTIFHCYRPKGEHYFCAAMNPLLLGIMRTLHTSLDFAPLLRAEETQRECEILIRFLQSQSALGEDTLSELSHNFSALFAGLIRSLDKVMLVHPDGMITTLFIREQDGEGAPVLCGTFHPSNKAHTIQLTR